MSAPRYELIPQSDPTPATRVHVDVVEPQAPRPAEALPDYASLKVVLPAYEEVAGNKEGPSSAVIIPATVIVEPTPEYNGMPVGTDGVFFLTFMIALLFNWLGYLCAVCMSATIAGSYGALSGLGLYLIFFSKFQYDAWKHHDKDDHSSSMWLSILCLCAGVLFFVRGFMVYGAARRHARVAAQ